MADGERHSAAVAAVGLVAAVPGATGVVVVEDESARATSTEASPDPSGRVAAAATSPRMVRAVTSCVVPRQAGVASSRIAGAGVEMAAPSAKGDVRGNRVAAPTVEAIVIAGATGGATAPQPRLVPRTKGTAGRPCSSSSGARDD